MRASILLVAALLAGCASPGADTPAAEGRTARAIAFAEPAPIDPDAWVSEPDLTILPDGTVLACGVSRNSDDTAYLWRLGRGEAWTRMTPASGGALIDCSWGVDAGGTAYFVTSAGGTLTVAATRDGRAWVAESSVGDGTAAYDRPWVAGGVAGEALVLGYHAVRGLEAWTTKDAGASWAGPFVAQRPDQNIFQTFSNIAWMGGSSFAFAYGPLEPHGAALSPHDLWLGTTDDGGLTWAFEEVAPDRGNFNNIFPSIAAHSGRVHIAWSESGEGGRPVVAHLISGAPGAWDEPSALHGAERTALMPRVAVVDGEPIVIAYAAPGAIQPSIEPAKWDVVVWEAGRILTVAAGIHEGTVATGGYGALADHVARNAGRTSTTNTQELLHNLGVTVRPDGGVVAAWASDASGDVRLWYAGGA